MRYVALFSPGSTFLHINNPRSARVAAILVLAAIVGSACSGDGAGPEIADVGTVQGSVVLEGAGSLAGVRVRLTRALSVDALFATTDEQGQYSADVPAGEWAVQFFDGKSYMGVTDGVTAVVTRGQTLTIPPFTVRRAFYQVELRQGGVFSPYETLIGAGAIVRWTNLDNVTHNVRFMPSGEVTSDDLAPGEQFELVFSTTGIFAYRCGLHPGEPASLVHVQEAY
jgi:plastocyanin